MKPIPELLVIVGLLIIAFFPYSYERHPLANYISYEKGKYSLLCITSEEMFQSFNVSEIHETYPDIIFKIIIQPIKVKDPNLKVITAPKFIIFDTEEIIYRTNSYEEALRYLKNINKA